MTMIRLRSDDPSTVSRARAKHDGGEGLERVGEQDDDVVDEAAQIAAEHTEHEPDGHRARDGGHSDLEGDPRAEDDAREQVPPELVGPEEVVPGRSLEGMGHVDRR